MRASARDRKSLGSIGHRLSVYAIVLRSKTIIRLAGHSTEADHASEDPRNTTRGQPLGLLKTSPRARCIGQRLQGQFPNTRESVSSGKNARASWIARLRWFSRPLAMQNSKANGSTSVPSRSVWCDSVGPGAALRTICLDHSASGTYVDSLPDLQKSLLSTVISNSPPSNSVGANRTAISLPYSVAHLSVLVHGRRDAAQTLIYAKRRAGNMPGRS